MNGTADIVFLRRVLIALVLATLATGAVGGAGVAFLQSEAGPQIVAGAVTAG